MSNSVEIQFNRFIFDVEEGLVQREISIFWNLRSRECNWFSVGKNKRLIGKFFRNQSTIFKTNFLSFDLLLFILMRTFNSFQLPFRLFFSQF
jgi:hypothetical protein